MALRVLVPSALLVKHLSLPGVQPILWHLNDGSDLAPAAEVLITERPVDPQRRSLVSTIPGLQHVHLLSIGYEWVVEHLPSGVGLSNSRGAVEDATAELALALILAALRQMPTAASQQAESQWAPIWTTSLHGASVMVLGVGGVGQQIISRLIPFRPARIIPVATHARRAPTGEQIHALSELPALLPDVDVVVVALPHTGATEHLVDSKFLSLLSDGALLVNVGRGPVVKTSALLRELANGRLRAALDVTDPEPLPADHPLWHAPGALITPHMAGNTQQFITLSTQLAVEQVKLLAAGKPPQHQVITPRA